MKRARIVLLAAEGRGTRSIAEEVGVQPRIVGNGGGALPSTAFADCRTGRGPAEVDLRQGHGQRILALLDKPRLGLRPMDGSAAGQGIGRR